MNSDYVAWNGERYVWPPPDGWYLASDGRWWAPDTGPEMDGWADNPSLPGPPTGAPIDPAAMADELSNGQVAMAQGDSAQSITTSTAPPALFSDPAGFDHSPVGSTVADQRFAEPDLNPTTVMPQGQLAPTYDPTPTLDQGRFAPTPSGATPAVSAPVEPLHVDPATELSAAPLSTSENPAILAEAPQSVPVKRSRTMPLAAAGLLIAAAVGIAALLAFLGGDDGDEQQQPSANLETEDDSNGLVVTTPTEDGAMSDDAMSEDAMDGDAMSEDAMSEDAMSEDAMSEDAMDDGAMDDDAMSEEGSEGESTETTSGATGEDAVKIGQFRTLLEDNQITAIELTGDDLMAFGVTACSYAESAADTAEYEQIRAGVLEGAQNDELTVDELEFIVDAAVTVYCPEDATRLGITLGEEAG